MTDAKTCRFRCYTLLGICFILRILFALSLVLAIMLHSSLHYFQLPCWLGVNYILFPSIFLLRV